MITNSSKIKYPALKVHCWGGFGSQINAASVVYELEKKFKNRKVVLILHIGGYYNNVDEISTFLGNRFNIIHTVEKQIKFEKFSPEKLRPNFIQKFIRKMLKRVLTNLGFISELNNEKEFLEIKPWTNSIRGHYAFRKHSKDFLELLINNLGIDRNEKQINSTAIHFRLGDLLTHTTKKPIEHLRVYQLLLKIIKTEENLNVKFYSDSPQIVKDNFTELNMKLFPKTQYLNMSADQTLKEAVESKIFIGTKSKVSFWILILRLHLGTQNNYFPKETKEYIDNIFKVQRTKQINYY